MDLSTKILAGIISVCIGLLAGFSCYHLLGYIFDPFMDFVRLKLLGGEMR